ncbi:MAG: hypothetical protein KGK34_01100 [Chloroflexota bacterium]|nr:hypothetical protein [Chloroflexota bacterium]
MSRRILGALAALTLAAACAPSILWASRPVDVPADWTRIGEAEWSVWVPPQWERDTAGGVFGEVIRFSLRGGRSRAPAGAAASATAAPAAIARLTVSRFRDELDLPTATTAYVGPQCSPCGSDVRHERLNVELEGRPATLTEVVRSDGWWEWHLVVQSTCRTYIVRIVVSGERVAALHDTVDHMLASVRLADDRRAALVGC